MSTLLQRLCKGHRHGKGPSSVCYTASSFSSKLPSAVCAGILGSELGQLCLSSARCLPVRLQQLVALDEGWKTIREGLSIPVCITPGTALHPGTSRSILDAGGSNYQLPLTVPEPGSQDPHPSSECLHLPGSTLPRDLNPCSQLLLYQLLPGNVPSSEICHFYGSPSKLPDPGDPNSSPCSPSPRASSCFLQRLCVNTVLHLCSLLAFSV